MERVDSCHGNRSVPGVACNSAGCSAFSNYGSVMLNSGLDQPLAEPVDTATQKQESTPGAGTFEDGRRWRCACWQERRPWLKPPRR